MYDTAKPRTLIIDHGGQVRNIDILGSSGQYGIAIIILFLFLRRSCRTWMAGPSGLALYTGEGLAFTCRACQVQRRVGQRRRKRITFSLSHFVDSP